MSTEIRKLTTDDWRIWKTIRLEALQLHPESFLSSFEREAILSDKEFEEALSKNDVFALFTEQSLVGVVGFYVATQLKLRHRGYLFGMYVKKGFRGKGFGNLLVRSLVDHAQQRVEQVHCTVVTDNVSAIKLYERVGFRTYGTDFEAIKVADRYYDEHLMVLTCPKRK